LQTGYFTLRQIKAATSNFDPANKIGGGFGPVYKVIIFQVINFHPGANLTTLSCNIYVIFPSSILAKGCTKVEKDFFYLLYLNDNPVICAA